MEATGHASAGRYSVCMCMCVCMCVCACVRVCPCMHMFVHVYAGNLSDKTYSWVSQYIAVVSIVCST